MKEPQFDKVFWYICACTATGLSYVFLITFISIPEPNIRFADTALGFFLGTLITSCLYYLTGGNPSQLKKSKEANVTTAEISASITTNPDEQSNNP